MRGSYSRLGPLLLGAVLLLGSCQIRPPASEVGPWVPLLEEPVRGQWVESNFGGGGEVLWESGAVELGFGSPLTGITWTGEYPRDDYEVELTATPLEGNDFFCGLTFPVGEGSCTLILGGWGGALTGLSCLDGEDASMNATKSFRHYPSGTPVAIRLVVNRTSVCVSLDGEQIIRQPRDGVEFSLRPEVLPSAPFGLASYVTRARFSGLRYRDLAVGAQSVASSSSVSPK